MSQIHINPELLNQIDKIFSRIVDEVYNLDGSLIYWYNVQIEEVGWEVARLEKELSFLRAKLTKLELEKISLKNKKADIQWQIASINPDDSINGNDRMHKISQKQSLHAEVDVIKNQIDALYIDIRATKHKESLCASNLENEKSHYMLLVQKKNAIVQNSNTVSFRTSDLLEKAGKKVSYIKNSIDGYSSIRVSETLGQNGVVSTKERSATTTTASSSDTLSFVKHSYESFSIDILANRAKVTLLSVQESFEIKKRDKTLVVLNKSTTLVQTAPQEYFETIECIARENALHKAVVWVENSIELYKQYGYTHKSTPTTAGAEMLKEFAL